MNNNKARHFEIRATYNSLFFGLFFMGSFYILVFCDVFFRVFLSFDKRFEQS